MDRILLGPHRRIRALPSAPERRGGGSRYHRRRYDALSLSARLVARFEEDRVFRQETAPVVRRHREEGAGARRYRRIQHPALRILVARQPLVGLREADERDRQGRDLPVFRRTEEGQPRERGPLRRWQSRVRSRRQVSLLPLEPLLLSERQRLRSAL